MKRTEKHVGAAAAYRKAQKLLSQFNGGRHWMHGIIVEDPQRQETMAIVFDPLLNRSVTILFKSNHMNLPREEAILDLGKFTPKKA